MKKEIKNMRNLEREIEDTLLEFKENPQRDLSKNFPLMIVDTGAIIDLVARARKNCQGKKEEKNPVYRSASNFLKYIELSNEIKTIITPETFEEIRKHSRVRLNGYQFEIPKGELKFAHESSKRYWKIYNEIPKNRDFEDARYLSWHLGAYVCKTLKNGNSKKEKKKGDEFFGKADRDIIATTKYFYDANVNGIKISPLFVLSSDTHLLYAIQILKEIGLRDCYTLSTRE